MIRGVAAQRLSQKGGWESGCSWVDLRGGAHYPQAGQATFVSEEEVQWGEAGFDSQDVSGSARKAVRGPPLDLMPEG